MRYLLALSLLLLPLSAQADNHARMRSNHIDFGLGMNGCVANGDDADCENVAGGFGLRVGYTYRFLPFLGAGLDFSWGTLSAEDVPEGMEEPSLSTMSVIPMLRGFYGVGPVGLSLGLGMGYYGVSSHVDMPNPVDPSQTVEMNSSVSTMTAFKLSVGAAYKISGQMGVGVYYDHVMGSKGEPSIEIDGEEPPGDGPGEQDFPGYNQFGLNFYYRL